MSEVEEFDFVIIGSGAASFSSALLAQSLNLKPVILEKTAQLGGSTAMSGGVIWAPGNPVMKRAGVVDSYGHARAYLDACAKDAGPASSEARRDAFLKTIPEAIAFLEQAGMAFAHAEGYSDYHEGTYPCGIARSRSLVSPVFDARRLGAWAPKLRRRAGLPPIMMHESAALGLNGGTWESKLAFFKVALRLLRNKLGADLVGTGAAIQGRLLEIALKRGIDIRTDTACDDFAVEDGRVTGVKTRGPEGERLIRARRGVLINAGGFSHNDEMRRRYQKAPTGTDWTNANPGDTGEILLAAIGLGAAIDIMEQCWWVSVSVTPDGQRLIHPYDMSKPHAILVDASGRRYVNESTSYMEVGIQMYKRNETVAAIPSWLVMDSRHRRRYRWGGHPAGPPPKAWLDSGYMIEAQSIAELAAKCKLQEAALTETVSRFNGFARNGVDGDFQRGESAYDRWLGDPRTKPNPNLGAIDRPPYYAVRLFPGDVGTCGGLLTDEYGRVLREDGSRVEGLYATGNSTASVMGRSYPGAGASIGASMAFGYLAVRHAAGET